MKKITQQNLLHDLNAIFDCVVYELCRDDSVEVHLQEGESVKEYDFPHLLAICDSLPVHVYIFVVKLNQLGILIRDAVE